MECQTNYHIKLSLQPCSCLGAAHLIPKGAMFFCSSQAFFLSARSADFFALGSHEQTTLFIIDRYVGMVKYGRHTSFFSCLRKQTILWGSFGKQTIFLRKKTIAPPPPLVIKWAAP